MSLVVKVDILHQNKHRCIKRDGAIISVISYTSTFAAFIS